MSDEDLDCRIRRSLPEIGLIGDAYLGDAVAEIWARAWQRSGWDAPEDCPKALELPPARTLVAHSRSVALMGIEMARILSETNGLSISTDEVIAISLLHDVCKLLEFEPTPDGAAKSELGRKYQHGFLSAFWMEQAGLSTDLVHAVIAHTPQSATIPQTQEALIVHYADFADSDALLLDAGQVLFCKRK